MGEKGRTLASLGFGETAPRFARRGMFSADKAFTEEHAFGTHEPATILFWNHYGVCYAFGLFEQ